MIDGETLGFSQCISSLISLAPLDYTTWFEFYPTQGRIAHRNVQHDLLVSALNFSFGHSFRLSFHLFFLHFSVFLFISPYLTLNLLLILFMCITTPFCPFVSHSTSMLNLFFGPILASQNASWVVNLVAVRKASDWISISQLFTPHYGDISLNLSIDSETLVNRLKSTSRYGTCTGLSVDLHVVLLM